MRILFLSIADPSDFSSGGNQRSNHIRDALMRIADVDTIAFTREGASHIHREWSADRVLRVNTAPSADRWERFWLRLVARRMIAAAEAANRYDFIVARYFGYAALVPPSAWGKLIVDGDDLRQTGANRSLARRAFVRVRAVVLRVVAKRLFHVWLVDSRDQAMVPGARTSMLPNTAKGVMAAAPRPPALARRILMVGMYAHPPNKEGLIWFARAILPRIAATFPHVEFHAIGQYYQRELDELAGVTMRGFVDDLAEEYRGADVVVCPIMSGSGTQIKVVEALMHGCPAVVSDFSYRGFADVLESGSHLLVACDEDEWVRHVTAVLDAPGRFATMAYEGRKVADRAYSVEAFSKRVIDTFVDRRSVTDTHREVETTAR